MVSDRVRVWVSDRVAFVTKSGVANRFVTSSGIGQEVNSVSSSSDPWARYAFVADGERGGLTGIVWASREGLGLRQDVTFLTFSNIGS